MQYGIIHVETKENNSRPQFLEQVYDMAFYLKNSTKIISVEGPNF